MQHGRVFFSNEKFLHVGLPNGRIQEAGGGGGRVIQEQSSWVAVRGCKWNPRQAWVLWPWVGAQLVHFICNR